MTPEDPAAQVAAVLSRYFGPGARLGVAVSGGSDSIALMHFARAWAAETGSLVNVASVDHGLRIEGAEEAAAVARATDALGLRHTTLSAPEWDGQGNLQDHARRLRRSLLTDWAQAQGLDALLLGHTLDDQAETVLLRLARGSGVDGLSAMSEAHHAAGLLWLRPMLALRRADLRAWLTERGLSWIEDPSNTDPRFDRVRMRQAIPVLKELGVSAERLAQTATSMARARQALDARARDFAERCVEVPFGLLRFDMQGLSALEAETRLRLLAYGLQWTARHPYRPRLSSLEATWTQVSGGKAATLHGCVVVPSDSGLFVGREHAAVSDLDTDGDALWDGRWRFAPPRPGLRLAALGEAGVRALDMRPDSVPRAVLLALPGFWAQGTLLSVPALSWGVSSQIYTLPDKASFLSGLISH